MRERDLPNETNAVPRPEALPARKSRLIVALVLQTGLSIVLLLTVIGLVTLMWLSGWSVDKIRNNVVQNWKDRFWQVNLEDRFRAETLQIASTQGNELTLAIHERKEVFERNTVAIVPLLNRAVPFTDRKTTVAFPATYRYHVLLNDTWSVEAAGETVLIRAPMLRPTLPVAFDSGQVETATEGWWVSESWAGTDKDALKARITDQLGRQAKMPEMIDAVRDQCRDSLANFVRTWLMKEQYWSEGRFTEIKVLFPDEPEELLKEMEPTLRLDPGPEPQRAPLQLEPAA
jgi:hypothetical protein